MVFSSACAVSNGRWASASRHDEKPWMRMRRERVNIGRRPQFRTRGLRRTAQRRELTLRTNRREQASTLSLFLFCGLCFGCLPLFCACRFALCAMLGFEGTAFCASGGLRRQHLGLDCNQCRHAVHRCHAQARWWMPNGGEPPQCATVWRWPARLPHSHIVRAPSSETRVVFL